MPRPKLFFGKDQRGVAALEFAITAPIALLVLVNRYDFLSYVSRRMAVQDAVQMAVQAIRSTCDAAHVPATTYCSSLNSAITTAIQSTSFGNQITSAGAPAEDYYCVNSASVLQHVSDVSHKPSDCRSVGTPTLTPGDYIRVQVQLSYKPIFAGSYAAALLTTPITGSAWMRLQ